MHKNKDIILYPTYGQLSIYSYCLKIIRKALYKGHYDSI